MIQSDECIICGAPLEYLEQPEEMKKPEHSFCSRSAMNNQCRRNAEKTCPAFTGKVGKRLHIGFDDSDAFTGSEMEVIQEFRRVRDAIGKMMTAFVKERI